MRKFLRDYRIEILVLLIALFGVFLLVEQYEIRVTLREAFFRIVETLRYQAEIIPARLADFTNRVSLSDFIGWMLLILSGAFIIWRVRYRFSHSDRWLISECPRCGSPIHRVHRSGFDRVITYLLLPHFHRYLCTNQDCRWSGLRRRVRGSELYQFKEERSQDYIPDKT